MLIWIYIYTHSHTQKYTFLAKFPSTPSRPLKKQSRSHTAFFFFSFFLFLPNQGEYFSPEEKQTGASAGIRGQWCVFKETFPPLAAPLSWVSPRGILMSGGGSGGRERWQGTAWTFVSGGRGSAADRPLLTPPSIRRRPPAHPPTNGRCFPATSLNICFSWCIFKYGCVCVLLLHFP